MKGNKFINSLSESSKTSIMSLRFERKVSHVADSIVVDSFISCEGNSLQLNLSNKGMNIVLKCNLITKLALSFNYSTW